MKKKTVFRAAWLDPASNYEWKEWLQEVPQDKYSARCSICNSTFSLSNMGKLALTSHMRGAKHVKNSNAVKQHSAISSHFRTVIKHVSTPSATTVTSMSTESSTTCNTEVQIGPTILEQLPIMPNEQRQPNTIEAYRNKKAESSRTEILWCLAIIANHVSMRAAERCVSLFPMMFSDSNIAKEITLKKDKISYTITFGLAPYFKRELQDVVFNNDVVVIGFDESLNKISQKQQMDINVRFWDHNKQEVCTRYFNSCFLGHSKAKDLTKAFFEIFNMEQLRKILQISMDGPNVNFSFLKDLQSEISSQVDPNIKILSVGSCGIHTVHNSFKTAIITTEWNIIVFLRSVYNLFKDVPARRADFCSYTQSNKFPMKFCAVRWVENVSVVKRCLEILPQIVKYVETATLHKTEPKSSSYKLVKSQISDPLLSAKLSFFQSFAGEVEPFLLKFQTDEPLIPLLYDELHLLIRRIMKRFVHNDILDRAKTVSDLLKIDVTVNGNLKSIGQIDLGFATKMCINKSKAKQVDILRFKQDCLTCFKHFCNTMKNKCPLKYKMVRGAACLAPFVLLEKNTAKQRVNCALEELIECNRISSIEADVIKRDFLDFIENKDVRSQLKSENSERLDHLYFRLIKAYGSDMLLKFVKIILILSHGNAALERGFSINKQCLIENLMEESLTAQRTVYDAIQCAGGVDNIIVNTKMIQSARNSNSLWKEYLRKKREEKEIEEDNNRKRRLEKLALKELATKKKKILEDAAIQASVIDAEMATIKNK